MRLPRYGENKDSGTWLGLIPSTWAAVRLMWVASVNDDVLPETTNSDYEIEYVDIGSVSLDRGIERTERINFADAPSRARRLVRDGDILVSTVRTYLKAIAPVVTPPGNLVVSTGFAVVRPALQLLSRYGKYALQATGFVDEVISRSTGVSYPAINASDLVRICVPVPPAEEQSAIAAFLDRETGKIDALIAAQEKLIALLAEKHHATISHAVTKGLNPNAPMKHSGVVWLGEVPTHWAIKRVKHLVKEGIAGPYGSSLTKSMYSASGYRVYGQQQVIPGDFSVGDYYISKEQFAEMSRYQVKPNDVLISVMGTIGRSAVVPQDAEAGIINPRLVLYRVIERLICPKYLQTFLNNPTSQRYFSLAAQGTTMEGLNMGSIGELHVALPPLHEQQEILRFVQSEGAKLDALSAESYRAVSLFKERRSALIAAAVTGKIDVRGQIENIAI